jgi:hypothetical protein
MANRIPKGIAAQVLCTMISVSGAFAAVFAWEDLRSIMTAIYILTFTVAVAGLVITYAIYDTKP